MRVEVMQYYGLTQPLSQAGYHETDHHKQLIKDIKGAVLEGRLIALCGVVGSGKTVTLRRPRQILKDENRVAVAKSLSVEKHSIKLATLISTLYYDLTQDKQVQIPKQSEKRERELQEIVKKGKRPVALFVDEAHDLNGHTLIGLKRLMEVVEDAGGRLSVILAGHPKLAPDPGAGSRLPDRRGARHGRARGNRAVAPVGRSGADLDPPWVPAEGHGRTIRRQACGNPRAVQQQTRTGAHSGAARPDACCWTAHLILPMKFNQFTVASCFSSFMLPHVLFVDEFETRKKATMSCCLAWNISLFPEIEQESHVERIWKMVEADNRDAAPPGLEQGFKQDLRLLVEQKNELFPWTHTNIPMADLIGAGVHDVLRIATGTGAGATGEIEILAWPNPTGLPLIIEHLRSIQSDTAAQVGLLEQASRTPGAFTDIEATQMTTAYCVQRADLVG